MKTCRQWLLLLLTFSGFGSMATSDQFVNVARSDDRLVRAEGIWKKIQTATAANPDGHRANLYDYWGEIYSKCSKAFDELAGDPDHDRMVEYFVDQFGRHGAQADLRWLIADPRMTLATCSAGSAYFRVPHLRAVQQKICEAVVRRCLDDPKFLRRYYVATVWSVMFLGKPVGLKQEACFVSALRSTREGFKKRPAREYWWFARNFVLLVHATGRDDLLKRADPKDFKKELAEFENWFTVNKAYLRADPRYPRWILDQKAKKKGGMPPGEPELPHISLPEKPFADWKGPPPPPASFLDDVAL